MRFLLSAFFLFSALLLAGGPAESQCVNLAIAGGTADALTVPALPCTPTTTLLMLSATLTNLTTSPTLSVNGGPAQTILSQNAQALTAGSLTANGKYLLSYNGANWFLLNSALGITTSLLLPHFTNNVALSGASSAFPIVVRDSFASLGDAPPMFYRISGSPCSLNGGAGDGGAQVLLSGSRCAIAIWPSGPFDVREWGADALGSLDSGAAIQAAGTWVGNNFPGSHLTGGGLANTYKVGTGIFAGVPVFSWTHPFILEDLTISPVSMTSTTDIFNYTPGAADVSGWGWQRIHVKIASGNPVWRDTFKWTDGGNTAIFMRGVQFHDILVDASLNRTGNDLNADGVALSQIGLFAESTFGPNVFLHECVRMKNLGDTVTLNGFTIATDGVVAAGKCAFDISLSAAGAGDFRLIDPVGTTYATSIFTSIYGMHVEGGEFECQSSAIQGTYYVSLVGVQNVNFHDTQFQGGGCVTPPKAVLIDTQSRNVVISPIMGTNMDTSPFTVAAAAAPTVKIDPFPNSASRPYFSANLNVNQTGVASNTITIVKFDNVVDDNIAGYSVSTGKYTPNIAGWYAVSSTVCSNAAFNSSYDILIQKNNSTVIAGPVTVPPVSTNQPCLAARGHVFLNGTTDYLNVAILAGLSGGTLTVEGNQSSIFAVERIGPNP